MATDRFTSSALLALLMIAYCQLINGENDGFDIPPAPPQPKAECKVTPPEVLVAVGDKLSLECAKISGETSIMYWKRGPDLQNSAWIYVEPVILNSTHTIAPPFIDGEYSVVMGEYGTSSKLTSESASLHHGGTYHCIYQDRVEFPNNKNHTATADVVVMASEPVITYGDKTLTCSMSFNGSAQNFLLNIVIKNSQGAVVMENKDLKFANGMDKHTADHKTDYPKDKHTCEVRAMLQGLSDAIYVRIAEFTPDPNYREPETPKPNGGNGGINLTPVLHRMAALALLLNVVLALV